MNYKNNLHILILIFLVIFGAFTSPYISAYFKYQYGYLLGSICTVIILLFAEEVN